ncbi:uncharacterized protein K444DRAFT_642993 [Hyaloscypha bicolor E]|uniref:Uncharacterized protein n=1 Tax=Hyaloscypha bicolor E TaxID=1095630 RepID=A0A2J6TBF2_9HELO|nr:uncharacterized protein K444DRAFT_642993 [Hyaloscypha bicolor E]PMD60360.1 hypothetical protein K444DRAFT_642993 [Hyaloscypha bicolor E]
MSWRGHRGRSLRREDYGSNDVGSRLRKLDELPEGPCENLAVPKGDQTRRLSILREKEIASNLAFLLATTDESLKVMAVCIKEYYNSEGITIRIVLNTRDLSAKTTGRLALITQLYEAINNKSVKARLGLIKSSLEAGRDRLESISDLYAEIGKAYEMSSMLELTLKQYLPEAIGKLARYYSATFELVYTTRNRTFICSSKSTYYLYNLFFFLYGGFYIPRIYGRLYNKWTLPDWLDIPVERYGELSRITTRLKATLDDKVRRASKSKKQYHFPNESASTSIVQLRPPFVQEGDLSALLYTEIPLTPPRTPLEPPYAGNSDIETKLNKLSLTLDFLQVFSGHLLIAQVKDIIILYKGYYTINIEDIPTTTELRLSYLQNSNELKFQL